MNWKSIGLHAAFVIVAWFVGSGLFGFIPIFIANPSYVHSGMMQKAISGYEVFGVWAVYRIGARLFRFPGPRGVMFVLIRLTWCIFAYVIVGSSVELIVGHPTLAAGLAGIPLAIVVLFLPRPQKPPAQTAPS